MLTIKDSSVVSYLGICIIALFVGTWNVADSGTLWPDGPRYANPGAMIHDWLFAGAFSNPYEFAKRKKRRW